MIIKRIDIIENNDDGCIFDITYSPGSSGVKMKTRRVINIFETCNCFMRNEHGDLADECSKQVKAFASLNKIEEITSKKFFMEG